MYISIYNMYKCINGLIFYLSMQWYVYLHESFQTLEKDMELQIGVAFHFS